MSRENEAFDETKTSATRLALIIVVEEKEEEEEEERGNKLLTLLALHRLLEHTKSRLNCFDIISTHRKEFSRDTHTHTLEK